MKICKGGSRLVFLTENYAIKIPRLDSWKLFLYGLLGNIHENVLAKSTAHDVAEYLCPIIWYTPGGFLSIMPRCTQQPNLYEKFLHTFKEKLDEDSSDLLCNIVEDKDESVGILKDKIVAIDYGS